MSKLHIERSSQRGKFSDAELRSAVIESRAYWSSPAGKARQAQLDREARNRPAPASLPLNRHWQRRLAIIEKTAPKI